MTVGNYSILLDCDIARVLETAPRERLVDGLCNSLPLHLLHALRSLLTPEKP